VCRKGKTKQRISLSELPLPSPLPEMPSGGGRVAGVGDVLRVDEAPHCAAAGLPTDEPAAGDGNRGELSTAAGLLEAEKQSGVIRQRGLNRSRCQRSQGYCAVHQAKPLARASVNASIAAPRAPAVSPFGIT
jgi:hypothetical protein